MQPEPVSSCLTIAKRGMDRIMLEVVVSGCVTTPADILKFVRCTLLSADHLHGNASCDGPNIEWQTAVADGCRKSLQKLGAQGFLEWVKPDPLDPTSRGCYRPLKLGRAAVAAGLQPEDALMMNEDVHMLARAVNLESDLHLMFLIAPVSQTDYLDWAHVHSLLKEAHRMRAVVRDVCSLSDIKLHHAEKCAARQMRGWRPEVCSAAVHCRQR
jgi:DNA polymerase theta